MLQGAYYEQEYWKREWSYVLLMQLFSTLFAVIFLILFYHAFAHLLGIHTLVRSSSFLSVATRANLNYVQHCA